MSGNFWYAGTLHIDKKHPYGFFDPKKTSY